jgi:uncharacterized membrane protein YcjF (UPF0283 family)
MARKPKPPTDAVEITEIEMADAATWLELWLLLFGSLVSTAGVLVIAVAAVVSLFSKIDTFFWLFVGASVLLVGVFALTAFRERARETVLLSRSSRKPKRKKGGTGFINAC